MDKNQQPPQAPMNYMQPYYAEDEINLVDVWIALKSYQRLFIKVFVIAFIVFAVAVLALKKDSYEVVSTIEIGSVSSSSGFTPLDSPESFVSKINSAILPSAVLQWKNSNSYEDIFETKVANAKKSQVITVSNKAIESEIPLFKDFQNLLSQSIVADHLKLITSLQAKIKSRLEIENLKLEELEDPLTLNIALNNITIKLETERLKLKKLQDKEFFGIQKDEFQNKIINARHILDNLKSEKALIEAKIKKVEESKKIVKDNIDSTKNLIVDARKNKKASLKVASENNAMSLMLIDNEIQQNQNRLQTLEERYYITFENNKAKLQNDLQKSELKIIEQNKQIAILEKKYQRLLLDNQLNIEKQKLSIEKVELEMDKAKQSLKNKILKQKQVISELQVKLNNYNETRVISEPVVSEKPVGLSKKILIVLMVFVAGFIAFIAILIALFRDKVKQRIAEEA